MAEIFRQSPVIFRALPINTEMREFWMVVLEYENETSGQYLVDLSHLTKWDVQSSDLSKLRPAGLKIPKKPGDCLLSDQILISRMNGTQASIWQLGKKTLPSSNESNYTDVTESTTALAIIGDKTFSITEKLSSLDFLDPRKTPPFLLQGPVSDVTCQAISVSKEQGSEGLMLTCSRAYSSDMIAAILDAGREFGLTPAGEGRFNSWMRQLNE
ncbi:MAG: sarcosine oxidase subunit gamma SoxG [Proteobacteria bacterium]|nr:sarcosine oxidase subunit gamma SoxG [Pseudomonadota bacterium]